MISATSDTKARFVGLVGLVCVAVWLTISLGSRFYLCLASRQWPTVPVRITSSSMNTGVSNVGRWWEPDVEYEYRLNGHTFRSSNVRFLMPVLYGQEDAKLIQGGYAADTVTRAAYDPQDPGRSVLEAGVPDGMWWRALIPVFFWALTGYLFYEINHPERRVLLRSNVETVEQE